MSDSAVMFRPWRRWDKDKMPSTRTINRWRKRADELAQEIGCPGACHLCFRPVEGKRGYMKLNAPGAYGWSEVVYPLCTACWALLKNYVLVQTAKLNRDLYAPEEI